MGTTAEPGRSTRDRITLWMPDRLLASDLASVLRALDQFNIRLLAVTTLGYGQARPPFVVVWPNRLPWGPPAPSRWVRFLEDQARDSDFGVRIVRIEFRSPGLVTLDGSGSIEKLIDILHSGKLQLEERRAIIDRIKAETEKIQAESQRTVSEATLNNMKALSEAVAVFQAAGLKPEEIRELIVRDPRLVPLVGGPVAVLASYQRSGAITAIAAGDPPEA
jgi:hypothetical protein